MNSSYPLLESVLMDSVKSNERAKWKSLESIASFGWTGSALLGGILADKHSYEFTFKATALMQLFGGLILIFIRSCVAPEVDSSNKTDNANDGRISSHEADGPVSEDAMEQSQSQPLLSSP
jgi:hypothetical protein